MQYNISEAEWHIMEALWECGETMTSAEIVEKVKDGHNRSPRTIKTLLRRLVSKGFVDFTVDAIDSRIYHYHSKTSRAECIQKENCDFVSLYYRGNVSSMLAQFIDNSNLTKEQIDELSDLLNTKKEENS